MEQNIKIVLEQAVWRDPCGEGNAAGSTRLSPGMQ